MRGMFDRVRPDAETVRRVKALVAERLRSPEGATLGIAELRCHETGCPPVETVITLRESDGSVRDWRIEKPIKDISAADIELLGQSS